MSARRAPKNDHDHTKAAQRQPYKPALTELQQYFISEPLDYIVIPSTEPLLNAQQIDARYVIRDPADGPVSFRRDLTRPLQTEGSLNSYLDLSVYKSPSAFETQLLAADIKLKKIAQLFELKQIIEKTHIYFPTASSHPCYCYDARTRRICEKPMSSETHFPALARATPYLHVGFHDSVCPWQGCTYAIPRNVVDSMLSVVSATGPGQLLEQHVLVEHFKAIPQCPLCQCDLRHPPMLPIQRSTYYVLTTHLASGWCVGLARIARAKGLPVPEPWKPARP